MRNNLKNKLWKTNPHDAKIAFEKELREVIEGLKIGAVEFDHGAIWAIKEILGDA